MYDGCISVNKERCVRTCQSSLNVLMIPELTWCSGPVITVIALLVVGDQDEDNSNCLSAVLSGAGRGRWVTLPLLSPLSTSSVPGLPRRAKRDVTCAVKGHEACSLSCRLRGQAGGACSWIAASAAYDCICDEERRGVRCNVGGENVCHVSCLAIGHTGGDCDQELNCQCSGRRNNPGLISIK